MTATGVTPDRLTGLRRWNLALSVLHAAQAVAVFVLANGFAITVTSSFPPGPTRLRSAPPRSRCSTCRSASRWRCSCCSPPSTTC